MNTNSTVLIAGAGPSGLMLACQLAIHKIPFRIIDKTDDHTTQSRALVMQARSVELLDQMGLAERAISEGQVAMAIGALFNGKRVVRVPVSNIGAGLTKFPYFLMLEQSRTEKILIDFLRSHGHEVERRTQLISLTQHTNEVLTVLKLPDGKEENLGCRFVVGADGAHSVVREQLQIPFKGHTYQETLFVIDCKAELDLPPNEMYLTFSALAIGGFFPLINGRWRILGNLPKELAGRDEVTFEEIEKNYAKRIGMQVKLYDPQWVAIYRSHHRYAQTFRKDSCFLIGDAAHIHSPVGAQGMNTGLQDAYNLAWKLTMVIKSHATPTLLDTYTEERITIARRLVSSTDRVFNLVTSSGFLLKTFRVYILPLVLKLGGPVFQRLKFIQRFAFKLVSEIGISYKKSSLSKNASFGNFPYHAPRPGDRLPYFQFTGDSGIGTSIQEQVKGTFFCFLIFDDEVPQEIKNLVAPWGDLFSFVCIPLSAITKELYRQFGIGSKGYYLIRPDRYIACRASNFDTTHLINYVQRLVGPHQV